MARAEEPTPSIFFLGASGLLGGPFLKVFRQKYPDIPITVLLRTKDLDEALYALGNVQIVHGTFDDLDMIEKLSVSHSVIYNSAASMNVPVTEAILRGIRARGSKQKSTLIHLSGAGNFVVGNSGNYDPSLPVWNDANPDDVRKIDSSYLPNGPCDEPIMRAAAAGEVNAFIVCPAGVYGTSANHIGASSGHVSASARGVWMDYMVTNVKNLGFSPYVGEGTSVFRVVHVDDTVRLMMVVFEKALEVWTTYQPDDVYKHFYLGIDEEIPSKLMATSFAETLYRMGGIPAPVARAVPFEEAGFVARYLSGNMMVDNENARSLGWKPTGPSLLEVLKHLN